MKLRLSLSVLVLAYSARAAVGDGIPPAVLDDLYRPWIFRSAQISPDGSLVAAMIFEAGQLRVHIIHPATRLVVAEATMGEVTGSRGGRRPRSPGIPFLDRIDYLG